MIKYGLVGLCAIVWGMVAGVAYASPCDSPEFRCDVHSGE